MNAHVLIGLLIDTADKTPKAEDVKAGWGAFGIFLALAAMVVFLGWALIKQLRRAAKNAEAGAFAPSPPKAPPVTIPIMDEEETRRAAVRPDADDL